MRLKRKYGGNMHSKNDCTPECKCGNCLFDFKMLDTTCEPCKSCLDDGLNCYFVKETRTFEEYFNEQIKTNKGDV